MIITMFTEEESGSERGHGCQGHKVASAGLWGTFLPGSRMNNALGGSG